MASVAVVTDTTQYMPREVVERHGLQLVSLYVNWAGRTDRESDLPDYDDFYAHLRTAAELPSTSQPSVGDFLAVYEPLLEAGEDIVSIHLSAGLSGTCASAEQARGQLAERGDRLGPDRDRRLRDGLRWPRADGHRRRQRGRRRGERDEAAAAARELRAALKLWFAVDTLEFLKKGGRIGAAGAWLGTALKIKPILTLEREVEPVERVRTSRPRLRAHGRVPARAPGGGRRPLHRPAHPGRRRAPSAWPTAAASSTAASRSSSPRSGR